MNSPFYIGGSIQVAEEAGHVLFLLGNGGSCIGASEFGQPDRQAEGVVHQVDPVHGAVTIIVGGVAIVVVDCYEVETTTCASGKELLQPLKGFVNLTPKIEERWIYQVWGAVVPPGDTDGDPILILL